MQHCVAVITDTHHPRADETGMAQFHTQSTAATAYPVYITTSKNLAPLVWSVFLITDAVMVVFYRILTVFFLTTA